MPSLTIRKIEPETKEGLRVRAAKHGRSMEAEARVIIKEAIKKSDQRPKTLEDGMDGASLLALIRRHVEPVGGIELDIPPRGKARELPDFQ